MQPQDTLLDARKHAVASRREEQIQRAAALLRESFDAGAFRTYVSFPPDWHADAATDATDEALVRIGLREFGKVRYVEELVRSVRVTVFWRFHR